jgi:outer membrane protein assembly factor BamB
MTALNKTSGALIWEVQVGQSIGASPMLLGERLCSGIEVNRPRANGYVACMARRTGQVLFYSGNFGEHTHGTPTAVWRTGPGSEDWSDRPPVLSSKAKTCRWDDHCARTLAALPTPFAPSVVEEFREQSCLASLPFAAELRAATVATAASSPTTGSVAAGEKVASKLKPGSSAGLLLVGANTGVLHAVDSATGAEAWRFATKGARARPILLQLQKDRRAAFVARAERNSERVARREAEAAVRLEDAKRAKQRSVRRGTIHADDAEWSQDDEDSFWTREEARETPLDEGEEEDLEALADERDPEDADQWVEEDTEELCERAPDLCEEKDTPWLWLLNNKENGNQGQIKGTMATYGHLCVFVSWDSFIYAVDVNDGRAVWTFQTRSLGMSSASILPASAYSASTAVDGLTFVGTHEWSIYALQLATGKLVWKYQTGGKIMSSGVLIDMGHVQAVREKCGSGNTWVLVWGSWDGAVYEFCASNGVLLAKKPLNSGPISNEIAIRDQTMYVSTNAGKVIALRAMN